MRKHPLIALTAFTALTASAIAGASTGALSSNTVLTSARTTHRPSHAAPSEEAMVVLLAGKTTYEVPPYSRSMVVGHERSRPQGIDLSSVTGLPVTFKPKPKPEPRPSPPVVEAVASPPVTTVAPPPVVVVTTTTTTTTTTSPPPVVAPAGGVWYELRMCESGDNYAEDSGNGYYGAYQFALSTWYGLGFTGLPSDASPSLQDEAAAELQARSGWDQWPSCSAQLGL